MAAAPRKVTSIYIDDNLKQFLRRQGKVESRTLSGQVEFILTKYRKEVEKGKKSKSQSLREGAVASVIRPRTER